MALNTISLSLKNVNPTLWPIHQGGETFLANYDRDQDLVGLLSYENVMPTKDGLASVVIEEYVDRFFSVDVGISIDSFRPNRLKVVWDDSRNFTYYMHVNGTHTVYDVTNDLWNGIFADSTDAFRVSHAYVNGVSYFFKETSGINSFTTNFAGYTTETVLGITPTNMNGICEALDYLIAWDDTTIYWSTPGSPLDFRPLVSGVLTGAGSVEPQDIRGNIIVCYPIAEGFIIYANENIVSARYSGNAASPWIFREVANSGGIIRYDMVGYDPTAKTQFAYTNKGIQEINVNQSATILAEITDFLAGTKYWESDGDCTFTEYQSDVNEVPLLTEPHPLAVKLTLVGNRYLCILFGKWREFFTNCLIYDINLKQWGRIKFDDGVADVFDFADPINGYFTDFNFVGRPRPFQIGVLYDSGNVGLARLAGNDLPVANPLRVETGEIVIGNLAWNQHNLCTLTKLKLFGDLDDSNMVVKSLTTDITGERITTKTWIENTQNSSEFLEDATGRSHKISISGSFHLTTVQLELFTRGHL